MKSWHSLCRLATYYARLAHTHCRVGTNVNAQLQKYYQAEKPDTEVDLTCIEEVAPIEQSLVRLVIPSARISRLFYYETESSQLYSNETVNVKHCQERVHDPIHNTEKIGCAEAKHQD